MSSALFHDEHHTPEDDHPAWQARREEMVRQLRTESIQDDTVLAAMGKVRRHVFIPKERRYLSEAYGNFPWPIGYGQTISQPYIVTHMTENLKIQQGEKILEIGTGSGYQSAILVECGANVYSVEVIPELAEHARTVLRAEGYGQVHILTGDGYQGWPEHAPFDAIIVTCAPEEVPQALIRQLKEGGRMVLPVGGWMQRLVILRKKDGQIKTEQDLPVRFVPMVHE